MVDKHVQLQFWPGNQTEKCWRCDTKKPEATITVRTNYLKTDTTTGDRQDKAYEDKRKDGNHVFQHRG